jgi:hypothetical protein
MPARIDRQNEVTGKARIAAIRNGQRTYEQHWLARMDESQSWIARAPHGILRTREHLRVDPPGWSALASVRTARRWLNSL